MNDAFWNITRTILFGMKQELSRSRRNQRNFIASPMVYLTMIQCTRDNFGTRQLSGTDVYQYTECSDDML